MVTLYWGFRVVLVGILGGIFFIGTLVFVCQKKLIFELFFGFIYFLFVAESLF